MEDQPERFSEPALFKGSPAIPGGVALPSVGERLFIDTNVLFGERYRLPLGICAVHGLLKIAWSPYVASEVARVATRNYAEAKLAQTTTKASVMEAIAEAREEIDRVIERHERLWSSPDPVDLENARAVAAGAPMKDEKDRPVLAGALATGSSVLLSLDGGFHHGDSYQGVVFWHPDTYLFALFTTEPDLYQVVREEMPRQVRARLRPDRTAP